MKAYDFEFDGKRLSDFNMMICSFGSNGLETLSNGSEITFSTVSTLNGSLQHLVSTQYESCLETTIQICKNSCANKNMEISPTELREITRWLSRKKFLKFKLLNEYYYDLWFEVYFNISRIELDGRLYGFELEIKTNRPYALKELRTINIKNINHNGKYRLIDTSHEEGYIYPHVEITINQSGDLKITNAIENRDTYIANCTKGEIIIMDYPIIESSIVSHKIVNDFNFNFFRVSNTYKNNVNDLTISIPCNIKISYYPIVKIGL